jgi:hypothetical protein
VESILPYNEDAEATAVMNVSDFENTRHRLLIDGNKVEGGDYLQIDNLGMSDSSTSNIYRKLSSSETAAGQNFVVSLMSGLPSDAIKNMDDLSNDLVDVNVRLLRTQIAEITLLYNKALSYLKSKVGQKIDIHLSGMDKAIEGELKVGKYKDSYDIKLNGNNYNFYPLELHPKMLADVNSQNLEVLALLQKYSSTNEFFNSSDFSGSKIYTKFNPFIYANEINLSSKKLNSSVSVVMNPFLNSSNFQASNETDLKITLPFTARVNRLDVKGLDFGKVISVGKNGKLLWHGVGEQNSFRVNAFNSYLMGKDVSPLATFEGKTLSLNDLLNFNKSIKRDQDLSFKFSKPSKIDYIRLLFWSSVGLSDDRTIYLRVRHLVEGMQNRKMTFQGVLRPYKGLNYITLAMPSDNINSFDLEIDTDDLMIIRSVKLFKTK